MPPKKKFSEEQVVEAAFDIAKSEGIDSITIRKVAERLGSSIAPIYVNFTDVEELKRAVINKVSQLSHQLIGEQNTGSPFGDIGAASLQFAKEYPVLIRDFVMKPNEYMQSYDQQMGAELVGHMKTDPELEGFTDEELMMILFKMRTFQTGLTIMVANGLLPAEYDLKKMNEISNSVAEDIVIAARLRKQGD
ncbi:TetR/AcrR family transcriptional regulator [Paenibacillus senegalensis]|uniref:TetR/AcrR family transcriptional regulator n=1 Tax=Paenibacillus senegalensis TaxID=1465766 RepID=UPI000288208D|nr:TetR/AcrR family transcriptional regulator [Paenibacillus senegalensis]